MFEREPIRVPASGRARRALNPNVLMLRLALQDAAGWVDHAIFPFLLGSEQCEASGRRSGFEGVASSWVLKNVNKKACCLVPSIFMYRGNCLNHPLAWYSSQHTWVYITTLTAVGRSNATMLVYTSMLA